MEFLRSLISKITMGLKRTLLRARTICRAYLDYRRCLKAEVRAFNEFHYSGGCSLMHWTMSKDLTLRAKRAFYMTLPVWMRPLWTASGEGLYEFKPVNNTDLNALLKEATKK